MQPFVMSQRAAHTSPKTVTIDKRSRDEASAFVEGYKRAVLPAGCKQGAKRASNIQLPVELMSGGCLAPVQNGQRRSENEDNVELSSIR